MTVRQCDIDGKIFNKVTNPLDELVFVLGVAAADARRSRATHFEWANYTRSTDDDDHCIEYFPPKKEAETKGPSLGATHALVPNAHRVQ